MNGVFHYLDYRHYLRDYYESQKKKRGNLFSYRSFMKQAGLSSPNFLKLVIEGKRNLGEDGIASFSKALKHNPEEARYFEQLVYYNQSTTEGERQEWYVQLSNSKRFRDIQQLEKDCYAYYSRWYYVALRELVLLPEFKEDPEWIAKKIYPPISAGDAKEGLALLQKLGLLVRNKKGCLEQANLNITTSREVKSLSLSAFHRQMILRAADSIERTPSDQRDISSLTVALSKEKFLEAKRRIQEFRRELNVLLSDPKASPAEAVYQLNFQIFNLSEVPWKP